jgi:opacity protein-like surface antigen
VLRFTFAVSEDLIRPEDVIRSESLCGFQDRELQEQDVIKRSWVLGILFVFTLCAYGQVEAAATSGKSPLAIGGSFSFFDAGYASNKVGGLGTYIDWSPFLRGDLGIEGEARWLKFGGSNGFSEYNYLAGPRYRFRAGEKIQPYAKFLIGAGQIRFPYNLAFGSYLAYAPGGGAELVLNDHWRVRGEYEFQIWPDAPGIPGVHTDSVKPNGFSLGFTYRVFRQPHDFM